MGLLKLLGPVQAYVAVPVDEVWALILKVLPWHKGALVVITGALGFGRMIIVYAIVCLLDKGQPSSWKVRKKIYVPGATLVVFHEKLMVGLVVLLPTMFAVMPLGKPLGVIEILSPSKSVGLILNVSGAGCCWHINNEVLESSVALLLTPVILPTGGLLLQLLKS